MSSSPTSKLSVWDVLYTRWTVTAAVRASLLADTEIVENAQTAETAVVLLLAATETATEIAKRKMMNVVSLLGNTETVKSEVTVESVDVSLLAGTETAIVESEESVLLLDATEIAKKEVMTQTMAFSLLADTETVRNEVIVASADVLLLAGTEETTVESEESILLLDATEIAKREVMTQTIVSLLADTETVRNEVIVASVDVSLLAGTETTIVESEENVLLLDATETAKSEIVTTTRMY